MRAQMLIRVHADELLLMGAQRYLLASGEVSWAEVQSHLLPAKRIVHIKNRYKRLSTPQKQRRARPFHPSLLQEPVDPAEADAAAAYVVADAAVAANAGSPTAGPVSLLFANEQDFEEEMLRGDTLHAPPAFAHTDHANAPHEQEPSQEHAHHEHEQAHQQQEVPAAHPLPRILQSYQQHTPASASNNNSAAGAESATSGGGAFFGNFFMAENSREGYLDSLLDGARSHMTLLPDPPTNVHVGGVSASASSSILDLGNSQPFANIHASSLSSHPPTTGGGGASAGTGAEVVWVADNVMRTDGGTRAVTFSREEDRCILTHVQQHGPTLWTLCLRSVLPEKQASDLEQRYSRLICLAGVQQHFGDDSGGAL